MINKICFLQFQKKSVPVFISLFKRTMLNLNYVSYACIILWTTLSEKNINKKYNKTLEFINRNTRLNRLRPFRVDLPFLSFFHLSKEKSNYFVLCKHSVYNISYAISFYELHYQKNILNQIQVEMNSILNKCVLKQF